MNKIVLFCSVCIIDMMQQDQWLVYKLRAYYSEIWNYLFLEIILIFIDFLLINHLNLLPPIWIKAAKIIFSYYFNLTRRYKRTEIDPDPIFENLYGEFMGKKCPCFAPGQEPCTHQEYFHKMRRRATWGAVNIRWRNLFLIGSCLVKITLFSYND